MDLTHDELTMLASVYYYPIHEMTSSVRPSICHAVIRSLVEHGLVFEILEKCAPGERSLGTSKVQQDWVSWVVKVTERGKRFFRSLSTFDKAVASRDAGLYHTMGKLIALLPADQLPYFLTSEISTVQEWASKRLAELTGEQCEYNK